VTFNGPEAQGQEAPSREPQDLGNELLELLALRTQNPSDAFVLLQQLCIYLWDTYKIDWESKPGLPVSPDRKVRYLSFVAGLIDQLSGQNDSETTQPAGPPTETQQQ
jgi:hypothetical protein